MRDTYGIFGDPMPQNLVGDFLLQRKAAIVAVNQNVGINEGGHECTNPLSSNLCL
jgi:hypothetical protein